MNKSSKGGSFFSGALRFLKGKPERTMAGDARKSSARVLQPQRAQSTHAPYRSAEIVCGRNACENARALSGIRFLARDVPRLPLESCTSSNCLCTYTRHNDRRNPSDERRAQFSMRTRNYATSIGNEERRRKYGRRAGEFAASPERYDFNNWDI